MCFAERVVRLETSFVSQAYAHADEMLRFPNYERQNIDRSVLGTWYRCGMYVDSHWFIRSSVERDIEVQYFPTHSKYLYVYLRRMISLNESRDESASWNSVPP
jgi:hypothetical protein